MDFRRVYYMINTFCHVHTLTDVTLSVNKQHDGEQKRNIRKNRGCDERDT